MPIGVKHRIYNWDWGWADEELFVTGLGTHAQDYFSDTTRAMWLVKYLWASSLPYRDGQPWREKGKLLCLQQLAQEIKDGRINLSDLGKLKNSPPYLVAFCTEVLPGLLESLSKSKKKRT
jgi:hypothetical protein